MIGSLTRSWATTTPILPLQVLVMPWSVKNVSLTMALSKRVCGKTLVSYFFFLNFSPYIRH
jgi:hypothetical protein